jgi:adenylylsulfate kinase-like enzyme
MSLDAFVGRTRELERYREFLTKETPWVLIIRGLGGSGKSTLLTEMEEETPRDTCVVTLDFAQKSLREAARDTTLKLTLATMQCMDIHRDAMSNIA